ncbi:MAG: hypothetical protein MJY46_04005 [Bacteroidales bacterium]|nr:hypothetical protein [Bacteroidales bacterium]
MMIFAAFAAALTLASCQKEVAEKPVPGGSSVVTEAPVFTATISKGTKTTVDATEGKVSWETTDEIKVTDKDQNTAVYKIESIDGTTGSATFVHKSGATLGEGPYTATYGTEPATDQTYSATPGKIYMTAPETSTNSFNFTVQCALMEINLTKSGESVSSVAVTGTPTGRSETTYTLTCTEAQSIGSQKSFYIAVLPGTYNKIVITDSGNKVCTLKSSSGVSVETNQIKPLTFDAEKLDFRVLGGGKFTVDSLGTKVHFSRGNLQATYSEGTYTWGFAEHQYDYIGNKAGNTSINSQTGNNVVDLFGWVGTGNSFENDAEKFGISTSEDKEKYGNTTDKGELQADWGTKIGEGWRTLTADEWDYLFNKRKVGDVDSARYAMAKVNEVNGVILLPDTYSHPADLLALQYVNSTNPHYSDNSYSDGDWKKLESAGAVFLPAAGYRNQSNVYESNNSGYYWSSTPGAEDPEVLGGSGNDAVYHVYFNGDGSIKAKPLYGEYCYNGSSVRLVTNL